MTAQSALEAALEYGGWNLPQDAGVDEAAIREYFTEENFREMFPGEDPTECGGFSLSDCAEAVIDWQREIAPEADEVDAADAAVGSTMTAQQIVDEAMRHADLGEDEVIYYDAAEDRVRRETNRYDQTPARLCLRVGPDDARNLDAGDMLDAATEWLAAREVRP